MEKKKGLEVMPTLNGYKKKLEKMGYDVAYIGLYGSQNYNLDDEKSDVDARAIIIPSLHDIIFRNVTSKVYKFETGEVDVKDLITFYDVIKKGNFTYCEAIQTKYSIGDKNLKAMFSRIEPNIMSMYGAMLEKRKALTHEYPSKKEEFEKWGFDPKQLHHIMRLDILIDSNIYSPEAYNVFHDEMVGILMEIKRDPKMSKEEAIKIADAYIKKSRLEIPEDYKYVPIDLSKEVSEYLENILKRRLSKSKSDDMYAREVRTYGNVPEKDIKKFPALEKYRGIDISYIVYESLEIL